MRTCPKCDYSLVGLPERHGCPECGLDYGPDVVVLHQAKPYAVAMSIVFVLSVPLWIYTLDEWTDIGMVVFFAAMGIPALRTLLSKRRNRVVILHDGFLLVGWDGHEQQIRWTSVASCEVDRMGGGVKIKGRDGKKMDVLDYPYLGSMRRSEEFVRLAKARMTAAPACSASHDPTTID